MLTPIFLNDIGTSTYRSTSARGRMFNERQTGIFVICDFPFSDGETDLDRQILKKFPTQLGLSFDVYDSSDDGDMVFIPLNAILNTFNRLECCDAIVNNNIRKDRSLALIAYDGATWAYANTGDRCFMFIYSKRWNRGCFYNYKSFESNFEGNLYHAQTEKNHIFGEYSFGSVEVSEGDRILMCTKIVCDVMGLYGLTRLIKNEDMDGGSIMAEIKSCTDAFPCDSMSAILIDIK